jgi:hypothetical protein
VTVESAVSPGSTLAFSGSSFLRTVRWLRLGVGLRHYQRGFAALHGSLFDGDTRSDGETGVYAGIRIDAHQSVRLWGAFDRAVFEPLQRGSPFSSVRRAAAVSVRWGFLPRAALELQWRQSQRPEQAEELDFLGRTVVKEGIQERESARITVEYGSSRGFRWTSRVEGVALSGQGPGNSERGMLVSQQLAGQWLTFLHFESRVTVFDADSYHSRLVAYEGDVPGAFSSTLLYGRGIRWYVLLRTNLEAQVGLSFKYAVTRKEGVRRLHTGLDEIEGGLENRIALQVDVAL